MRTLLTVTAFLALLVSCKRAEVVDNFQPDPRPRLAAVYAIDTTVTPNDTLWRQSFRYDGSGRTTSITELVLNNPADTALFVDHRIEYGADTNAARSIIFTRETGGTTAYRFDTVFYRYANGRFAGDSVRSLNSSGLFEMRVRRRSFTVTGSAIDSGYRVILPFGGMPDTSWMIRTVRQNRVGVYVMGQTDSASLVSMSGTPHITKAQVTYNPSVTPNPLYWAFRPVIDDLAPIDPSGFPEFFEPQYGPYSKTVTIADGPLGTTPVPQPAQTTSYTYTLGTNGWPVRMKETRTGGSGAGTTVFVFQYQ